MTHRLLTDADLEPVSDAQLQAAIAVVIAMTNDEMFDAALVVGLDPWSADRELAKARRKKMTLRGNR